MVCRGERQARLVCLATVLSGKTRNAIKLMNCQANDSVASPPDERGPTLMDAITVEQLKAEDCWPSHPLYGRDDWKHEVSEGNTQRGYWDWVEARLQDDEDQEQTSPTP